MLPGRCRRPAASMQAGPDTRRCNRDANVSRTGHSGAFLPKHCVAVAARTFWIRLRSAILERISLRCPSVNAMTSEQVCSPGPPGAIARAVRQWRSRVPGREEQTATGQRAFRDRRDGRRPYAAAPASSRDQPSLIGPMQLLVHDGPLVQWDDRFRRGWSEPEGRMRADRVIVSPPSLDDDLSLLE